MTSRWPMKRRVPYLRNLILTFNADPSFPLCHAAAGTLLPAVWCDFAFHGSLPLSSQELLCHADIDKVPGEDLVCVSLPLVVKGDVHACLFKGFQPFFIVKILAPG